jgi:pimeloyl-ACP methyl ester carboxylesterase
MRDAAFATSLDPDPSSGSASRGPRTHAREDRIEAPGPIGLLGEARGFLEFPRLLARFPHLAKQPGGAGERILVLPGYGAGDGSTAVLRAYLGYLGYRPRGWGLGRNRGDVPELIPLVIAKLQALVAREGAPIGIIGWSLGGVIAREAARECPEAVTQLITLGSPVVGGPKYTAVAEVYRRQGVDLDAIEVEIEARNVRPIETPVTAVYTRSDAVVAWRACIDRHSKNVDHVEVGTTHLGLGFSPEVYQIIAQRLARKDARSRHGGKRR